MAEKQEPTQAARTVRLPGFTADRTVGMGDLIKRAASITGVKPCGPCERRAQRLNAWLAFTGKRALLEEQITSGQKGTNKLRLGWLRMASARKEQTAMRTPGFRANTALGSGTERPRLQIQSTSIGSNVIPQQLLRAMARAECKTVCCGVCTCCADGNLECCNRAVQKPGERYRWLWRRSPNQIAKCLAE
jgi:hypothetical protein